MLKEPSVPKSDNLDISEKSISHVEFTIIIQEWFSTWAQAMVMMFPGNLLAYAP